MADIILLKQLAGTGVVPLPLDLSEGELAINPTDRAVYSKDVNGVIYDILRDGQGQSIYFDGTSVVGTSQVTINTFNASAVNSTKYTIQLSDGTDYHMLDISVVHNGTDVQWTEYSTLKTAADLASFSLDILNGFVRLLMTPVGANTSLEFSRLDVRQNTSVDKSVNFLDSTTSGTSQQVIDTFDKTVIRAATYEIEIKDTVGIEYSYITFKVLHDDTTATGLVVNALATNTPLGTITTDININDVRLLYTPNVSSTEVSMARIDLKV